MSESKKFPWVLLLAISVLVFLLNIDYTSVNLALLPISEDIAAPLSSLQWLISGYVLVWAALVLPSGRFADLYGKKSALSGGIGIFILGSLIAGFGSSIEILILGRIFQGIGAAIFTPPCYGIVFTQMPVSKQGFSIGVIGGAGGLGLAIGPTLAGYLVNNFHWRWIFYMNIPLGLLVLLIVFLSVPKDGKSKTTAHLDLFSAGLFAGGLALFMIALNKIEEWGLRDVRFLGILALSFLSLLGFWLRDRKKTHPILPLKFFQNKALLSCMSAITAVCFNFGLVLVIIGLYLQNTLHYSSYETGLIFLPMTLAIGLLSPLGGKLGDRLDIRWPILMGLGFIALGSFLMSSFSTTTSLAYVLSALLMTGIGLGLTFPTINTALLRSVSKEDVNTASGFFTTVSMLGNSLSVILSTNFLVIFGRQHLTTLIKEKDILLSKDQHGALVSVLGKVEHTADELKGFGDQAPSLLEIIDQAFMWGVERNMWIGTLCALASLAPVYVWCQHLKSQKNPKNIPIL
jgi:EmrB/QacA subfamily drug resistance transporter